MKKSFACSLCHSGILGGGLYIEDTSITYKTNKLTVDRAHRHLVLPFKDIQAVSWKWILFPIATFRMADGKEHKFIIYNKKRFNKYYNRAIQASPR